MAPACMGQEPLCIHQTPPGHATALQDHHRPLGRGVVEHRFGGANGRPRRVSVLGAGRLRDPARWSDPPLGSPFVPQGLQEDFLYPPAFTHANTHCT